MGHSLGGYFTLYALLKELKGSQTMFNHYVSASPSIDYHDQYLLKEFKNCSATSIKPQNVLITYSNIEEDDNINENDRYLSLINDFVTNAKTISGIKIREQEFQHAAHMETAMPSFIMGLQHK